MTIEQTVIIPASRRITIEVPPEIPAGKTIITFTPAPKLGSNSRTAEEALIMAKERAADPDRKPISHHFGKHFEHFQTRNMKDVLNGLDIDCAWVDPEVVRRPSEKDKDGLIIGWGGSRIRIVYNAFHGGGEIQHILPHGTHDDARKNARILSWTLGKSGGYIFPSCHNWQSDVPIENVLAFYELENR